MSQISIDSSPKPPGNLKCYFRVGEPILEESPAVCILKRDDELGAERVGRTAGKLGAGKHCEFCLRKVVHMDRCDTDRKLP